MRPKKNDSILEKNWPRNDACGEDNPYEALVLGYNREMDQPVEANTINNEMEEEDFETCPYGKMMESDDKEENTMPRRCLYG
jgi:hypothetical protein